MFGTLYLFAMMYLFTTVPHPHGHWQLQELLGNLLWSNKYYLYNVNEHFPGWPERYIGKEKHNILEILMYVSRVCSSVAVIADVSVRSPRKSTIFVFRKKMVKVSPKTYVLNLKIKLLLCRMGLALWGRIQSRRRCNECRTAELCKTELIYHPLAWESDAELH